MICRFGNNVDEVHADRTALNRLAVLMFTLKIRSIIFSTVTKNVRYAPAN